MSVIANTLSGSLRRQLLGTAAQVESAPTTCSPDLKERRKDGETQTLLSLADGREKKLLQLCCCCQCQSCGSNGSARVGASEEFSLFEGQKSVPRHGGGRTLESEDFLVYFVLFFVRAEPGQNKIPPCGKLSP